MWRMLVCKKGNANKLAAYLLRYKNSVNVVPMYHMQTFGAVGCWVADFRFQSNFKVGYSYFGVEQISGNKKCIDHDILGVRL